MKKSNVFFVAILVFIGCTISGCKKPIDEPKEATIVATLGAENSYGPCVEIIYSDSSKMYFQLLSDSTAEIINYHVFYDEDFFTENENNHTQGWIYRGDVVIPQSFTHNGKNYTVVRIGNYAFGSYFSYYNASFVTSVVIPNTVTEIGAYAFCDCESLATVNIPNSVNKTLGYTFTNCKSLTSVTIPPSLTKICLSDFAGCENLTEINIPNTIISIEHDAFRLCTSLTSIEIPSSVYFIGGWLFSDCTNLKTIIIKNTTPLFEDDDTFYPHPISLGDNLDSLENIYVPSSSVEAYKNNYLWRPYAHLIKGL